MPLKCGKSVILIKNQIAYNDLFYGNKGRVLYGIQVWTIFQDTWDSILIDYVVIFDTKMLPHLMNKFHKQWALWAKERGGSSYTLGVRVWLNKIKQVPYLSCTGPFSNNLCGRFHPEIRPVHISLIDLYTQ